MIVEHVILSAQHCVFYFVEHIIEVLVNDLKISKDEIRSIRYHFADV